MAAPHTQTFDVVVVGAGPAGSATARWLAAQGWRVALLERSCFESARVGESLAPDVQGLLRALGVWPEFLALDPLPSWGTRSVWGESTPQSHSHLSHPYGCGWHVDRQAFDAMLARSAGQAGVQVFTHTTLRHSRFDGRWRLAVVENTGAGSTEHVLEAGVLIDATGRKALLARALGGSRMLFDRLVGVALQCSGGDAGQRGHLLVESAPEGWWYSAPLPDREGDPSHRMIAMLMTDADLCAKHHLSSRESWLHALGRSDATRERMGDAWCTPAPHVHAAVSQRLRRDLARDAGPWLAVGDAALAVDPVSGSGVPRALRTARAAADAVGELLRRPASWRQILAAYERDRDEECTRYLFERAAYYGSENRYDTLFWRRRRVWTAGTAETAASRGSIGSQRDQRIGA